MAIKKSYLITIGFFVAGAFGLVHVVNLQSDTPAPPTGVFEKAGYQVLIPHVDKQPPGYFNTIERSTRREVSLHRTCNIPFAEIEPFIVKTRTVDERISRKLRAGYKADASVLAVDGSVELGGVRQVYVRYENSAIWYLSTESLYNVRDRYLRGSCQAAIERELMKGLPVCQVKKVIVSDIVFEITYESGTTTKVAAPADSISAEVSADSDGRHDIIGKKMFHAVKMDEACFKINPDQSAT